jgi:hypothetical protein
LLQEKSISLPDINLLLSSILVMGLNEQPQIADYFKNDEKGIFGCEWMKNRFTQHKWSFLHYHIHYEVHKVMGILRNNIQNLWTLNQVVITDEMIIPFTGRWKYVQHVKNKPHNTGINIF